MVQAADNLRGAVIARDPLDTNGALIAAAGKPVQKLMRPTLVGEEESMEEDEALEESEDEDLPEEGLAEETLRRDASAEMACEIALMLWRVMTNGLPVKFQVRAQWDKRLLIRVGQELKPAKKRLGMLLICFANFVSSCCQCTAVRGEV